MGCEERSKTGEKSVTAENRADAPSALCTSEARSRLRRRRKRTPGTTSARKRPRFQISLHPRNEQELGTQSPRNLLKNSPRSETLNPAFCTFPARVPGGNAARRRPRWVTAQSGVAARRARPFGRFTAVREPVADASRRACGSAAHEERNVAPRFSALSASKLTPAKARAPGG